MEEREGAMQDERRKPAAMASSLSFSHLGGDRFASAVHHDSPKIISAAPLQSEPPCSEEEEEEVVVVEEDDFEFAVLVSDPENDGEMIAAAEDIFSDGLILPVYAYDPAEREQIRRMLRKEASLGASLDSATSSEVDELEQVSPEKYCAWTPGPGCKKSPSTGTLRRWRIRDLLAKRSRSDGKEKFVFLAAGSPGRDSKGEAEREEKEEKEKKGKGKKKKKAKKKEKAKEGGKAGELDVVTSNRVLYGKGGEQAANRSGRRSFLPYKKNVVGFFARVNAGANV